MKMNSLIDLQRNDQIVTEKELIMKHKRDFLVIPFLFLIVAILILSGELLAQSASSGSERINRDIEIMGNVLDKLIIKDSPFMFRADDRASGVYLDGFGIMFDMESYGIGDFSSAISYTLKNLPNIDIIRQEGDRIVIGINEDSEDAEDIEKSVADKVEATKTLLTEFFRDYASSVKSLPDNELICVNIRVRGNMPLITMRGIEDRMPTQLRACANVADLTDYRRGKITEAVFEKKVSFQEEETGQSDRDIEIMENIFDSGLERFEGRSVFQREGITRGMYVGDFGVLFVVNPSISDKFEERMVKRADALEKRALAMERIREKEERMRHEIQTGKREDSSDDDDEDVFEHDFDIGLKDSEKDSIVTVLTDDLLALLGQYGHTLKKVKDNQWIMITVEFDNYILDEMQKIHMKVRKSDVMKFNRDQIDFEAFKQKVQTWKG